MVVICGFGIKFRSLDLDENGMIDGWAFSTDSGTEGRCNEREIGPTPIFGVLASGLPFTTGTN